MTQDKNERLSELYVRYSGAMYRTAMSVLHNTHDAQDAVQDSFVNLLTRDVALDDENCARALLMITVRNTSLDMLRREHEHIPLADVNACVPDFTALSESGAENVTAALPERLRRTVELRYICGLRAQEVSVKLGIKPAVVHYRLRMSRKLLRLTFPQKRGIIGTVR